MPEYLGHGVERERCDHCLCVCAVRAWLEGGGTQRTPQTGGRAHTSRLHAVEAVADANHRRPLNCLFLCMHGVGGEEMVDPKQRVPIPAPRNNRNDTGKMGGATAGRRAAAAEMQARELFFFRALCAQPLHLQLAVASRAEQGTGSWLVEVCRCRERGG